MAFWIAVRINAERRRDRAGAIRSSLVNVCSSTSMSSRFIDFYIWPYGKLRPGANAQAGASYADSRGMKARYRQPRVEILPHHLDCHADVYRGRVGVDQV